MIDFLSDTVTTPTEAMREAMHRAVVGDDVYGEDTTTVELEAVAADMMGKEAACFVPSGTMANLVAILAQCPRGHELLVGDESDLYNYEAGGVSALGGVVLHPVPTDKSGELSIRNLTLALRDGEDPECARAGAVSVETPNVQRCGAPLSLGYLRSVAAFAASHRLPLHIDGARIFNAAVALGVDASAIAAHGDTVQFCLSKSLGCPVGSIIAGRRDTLKSARRWRKMLGGGMRQTGSLAAAGLYALRNHVSRLADDHALACRLAAGLATIDEIELSPGDVATNIVVFRLRNPASDELAFLRTIRSYGVRFGEVGAGKLRAVTHLHHDAGSIDDAIARVKRYFTERRTHASPRNEALNG